MSKTLDVVRSGSLLVFLVMLTNASPAQTVWNAANEFSNTQNPSGAWSYGWSANRGAPFSLFASQTQSTLGFPAWGTSIHALQVGGNIGTATACFGGASGGVRVPPSTIEMHPGRYGENAVLRWTAPVSSFYQITVAFAGLDYGGPTTTDVAVLHNGVQLHSSVVMRFDGPSSCQATGWSATVSFASTVSANAGDVIDFTVGYGPNHWFSSDTTLADPVIVQLSGSGSGIALANTFGSGCGNPALGLLPVANARPMVNTTALMSLTRIPSCLSFVALGWSRALIGPFALPFPLVGYDMPGCYLLQSTDAMSPATPTGSGTAVYGLPLPNWGGLLGLSIYLQGWAPAPGVNAGGVIVSNGVEWVIGDY